MNSPLVAAEKSTETSGGRSNHGRLHLLMLLATFCWAENIVAGKEALAGFGVLALAQLRTLGASLIFALLFLARRRGSSFPRTRREWLLLAAVALCGVTFNQLTFIGGLSRTTVAHTGLIVALGPVMVLVLSCLLRLEDLTIFKFVGMLIAFVGVAVLTTGGAAQANGGQWVGDVILLASSAVFAAYVILVKEVVDRYDPLTLNTLTYVLGTLFLLPLGGRAVAAVRWHAVPVHAGWGLAFMIVLGSVVPYLIFAYVMTELTASRVAAFSYLQPVIASGLGIGLLGEKLTLRAVTGGAMILLGVYLTERERREERTTGRAAAPAPARRAPE